jgi:hypothetical protein
MMSESRSRYFCIHGHFYQPPRENPLIDQIELQPSAQPSHDWNERVFLECYAPNGASRILDGHGRIRDILNNYAYMSFNIGPTLFSWLEEKHPFTYSRILEADRLSCERLQGHGNAMAQVYNHVIMPLATAEQKALQVKWGIQDFERRYGRKPEGMWLAETAVNMDTVVALIREGIKFTVLAPTQAQRVRPLHGDAWTDVSHNNIDPRRPYRIFPVAEDGTPMEKGYLDVFFYDGPLSHGVGFEHLVTNASTFGERIASAFDAGDRGDQLVSVCTDGESYGHHEAFGDMCAAFLFKDVAPRLHLEPVNYGWYLARHPPAHEVRLKNAHGEGTAWSCAHGVGRWKEDCGCSNGGAPGWNQKWRAPLRRAMDLLFEAADRKIAEDGPGLFADWAEARDHAVGAWDPSAAVRKRWWDGHLKPGADAGRALAVLETLRYSQYVFTSCAWFFADVTGIEAQQNLKYALRVLQLLQAMGVSHTLRERFLGELALAESNIGGKTGDRVFLDLEKEMLPLHAYLSLGQWVQDFGAENFPFADTPDWKCESRFRRVLGPWSLRESRFAHAITGEKVVAWLVFRDDGFDTETFVHRQGGEELSLEKWELAQDPHATGPGDWFGDSALALQAKALPVDIRDRMALHLKLGFWAESEEAVCIQERRLAVKQQQFQRLGWPLPQSILQTLHTVENFRLVEALMNGLKGDSVEEMKHALELSRQLRAEGVTAHLGPAKRHLHQYLLRLGRRVMEHPEKMDLQPFFLLLDLVDTLKMNLERYRIENLAFPILKGLNSWCETGKPPMKFDPDDAILLLDRLNFNTEAAKRYLESWKKTAAAP